MAGTFIRLNSDDFVVSADSVTSPLWSNGAPTLTKFYSSSVQEAGSSGNYYLNIYQTASALDSAEIQFAITYGDALGSGSSLYNAAVSGLSYSRTIYGQYRNLVLGTETGEFVFGNTTSSYFWAISIDRSRYKQSLLPGIMTLKLSGSGGIISLTDNSRYVASETFNDAGRVYELVSGSAGTLYSGVNTNGYSATQGAYGWFLPDIATILINPLATSESINLAANRTNNSDGLNNRALLNALNLGATFTANSQETIAADYIFVRARNAEFNYSENPSFISGSTGEIIYDNFINNPQTFPTTIGLYNDNNELLAVAKLSRPLLKDFTKEALVRVKLDF